MIRAFFWKIFPSENLNAKIIKIIASRGGIFYLSRKSSNSISIKKYKYKYSFFNVLSFNQRVTRKMAFQKPVLMAEIRVCVCCYAKLRILKLDSWAFVLKRLIGSMPVADGGRDTKNN